MSLDETTVARIARLARLEVPEADRHALSRELSQILDWVEQLGEVPTDDVEPLRTVMEITHPWRADEVTAGGDARTVTQNAPKAHDGYFVVPKVVE